MAEFDVNSPITLRGKVVRMEWINPHAWIHGHGDRGHGVAGEGRFVPGEWEQYYVPGWEDVVSGVVEYGSSRGGG
jgi:hypothetical protein